MPIGKGGHGEKAGTPVESPATSDTEALDGTGRVDEKALLRKLDYHLLPAVGILYLLSFLDRSNGTTASRPLRADLGAGADPTMQWETQGWRAFSMTCT